jgi:general secretion pathway protein G
MVDSSPQIRVPQVRQFGRLTWGYFRRQSSTPPQPSVILNAVKNPRILSLHPFPAPSEAGFTLLELLIVMVVIAILAAIAVPRYANNVKAAKEAVLRSDLHVMRDAIDSYTVDKGKAPQSLDDLVQSGYLRAMPKDPFTNRTDTWMPTESDSLSTTDQTQSGIDDVHSGAQLTATDGSSYNTW